MHLFVRIRHQKVDKTQCVEVMDGESVRAQILNKYSLNKMIQQKDVHKRNNQTFVLFYHCRNDGEEVSIHNPDNHLWTSGDRIVLVLQPRGIVEQPNRYMKLT